MTACALCFADSQAGSLLRQGGLARIAYGAVIDAGRQMAEGSFAAMASGVSGKKLNDLFGNGAEIR